MKTLQPALGTDAPANSQDFGTFRWRLSAHATSFDCRTKEAPRSGTGTFRTSPQCSTRVRNVEHSGHQSTLWIHEFTHLKSAAAQAITRCGSNSAIWIAFSAAPFSN